MPQSSLFSYFNLQSSHATSKIDTGADGEPSSNDVDTEREQGTTLEEVHQLEASVVENNKSEQAIVSEDLEIRPFPTPHPSLTIVPVQKENLAQIKRLTATLLQVKYSDDIFNEAASVDPIKHLSRQAVFGFPGGRETGSPVGWIRCRLEVFPMSVPPEPYYPDPSNGTRPTQIYIQILCLLAPYRGYGVASSLLDAILSDKDVLRNWDVRGIYAHVWESNEEGLKWYKKRGFKKTVLIDGYYRKLKPSRAWLVWLPLEQGPGIA